MKKAFLSFVKGFKIFRTIFRNQQTAEYTGRDISRQQKTSAVIFRPKKTFEDIIKHLKTSGDI